MTKFSERHKARTSAAEDSTQREDVREVDSHAHVVVAVEAVPLHQTSPAHGASDPRRDEYAATVQAEARLGAQLAKTFEENSREAQRLAPPEPTNTRPWHPRAVAIENPAAHWKESGRSAPLILHPTLEAIARAWKYTKTDAVEDGSAPLRDEYSRLIGWGEHARYDVTTAWLAEQLATYQVGVNRGSHNVHHGGHVVEPWTGPAADDAEWLAAIVPGDLPAFPFSLRPGHTVTGPAFLASLQAEAVNGPRAPRARTGATQADIASLREAIALAAKQATNAEEIAGIVDMRRKPADQPSIPAPSPPSRGSPKPAA